MLFEIFLNRFECKYGLRGHFLLVTSVYFVALNGRGISLALGSARHA